MNTVDLFQQFEEKLRLDKALPLAINQLIDAAFNSKNNFIPLIDDATINQALVAERIVELYEGRAYMVQESLLLAHVVSQVLQERFQTESVDNPEKVDAFLEQVDQFCENSPFRLGRNAVTKMLRPYVLLYLNLRHGYEFDDFLSIDNEKAFTEALWERIRPMQKVLPYLQLNLEKLFAIIEKQVDFDPDLFEWYQAIGKLISGNVSLAWTMLQTAKNRGVVDHLLIANILNFISRKDFESAFQELSNLFTQPGLKITALFGFSFLEYPDPTFIERVLELVKKEYTLPPDSSFKNPTGATCVNIVNSPVSSESQKQQAIVLLGKMALNTDANRKIYLLFDLGRLKKQERVIGDILKQNYITGQPEESAYWPQINHILSNLENKEDVFDLLEQFILQFPRENFAEIFEYAISKIPETLLRQRITLWFNDDRPVFNYKAGELVRRLNIKKIYPTLDELLLNNLRTQDIQFIVFKIMGYVVSPESLSTLTFSILNRIPKEETVNELVVFAFQEYILFNYKSTAVFLQEKRESGTQMEKEVAENILSEFESRRTSRLQLEFLKELQPPSFRIETYLRRQAKVYDLEQSIKENSLFMHLSKNIKLRAGRGFFGRNKEGEYSPVAPLQEFATKFELPAGEFIDATGQAVFRAYCQSFKRQK